VFTGDWSCEDGVFVQHLGDFASLVAVTHHIKSLMLGLETVPETLYMNAVFHTRLAKNTQLNLYIFITN